MPTYNELRTKLWNLCFPDDEYDNSSLQDLYDHAHRRHPRETAELVRSLLTVNPNTLPSWYKDIFSLSWSRCYTLNIDDLASAAEEAFSLPRPMTSISATTTARRAQTSTEVLEVIHLNGTLDDLPNNVTFSLTQFADRLARFDPFYSEFTADLISRPVIIIGTRLDEPPLWQHIAYRQSKGGRNLRELRPRSYLVTPQLSLARRALLSEMNIHWIPLTARNFIHQVLSQVKDEARSGLQLLIRNPKQSLTRIPIVANLAVRPNLPSDFLLGQEPLWADLQSGRAVERSVDDTLWSTLKRHLSEDRSSLTVVTGTAGSGKSTTLMRACLRLQGEGTAVGWLDRERVARRFDIVSAMRLEGSPRVLAIDDADLYGSALTSLVRSLVDLNSYKVIVVAIRSSKVDQVLHQPSLDQMSIKELSIPHLTDSDIDNLLDVLNEHNRLGVLKGKSRSEQRFQFQKQAGRQLLVAMIQATSDRRFEEKAMDELTDLKRTAARVYGFVAVAHSFRFGISRDELIIATADNSNRLLNSIDRLVNRKILNRGTRQLLWTRHRVIAGIIHDGLQESGQVNNILRGLACLAASKAAPGMDQSSRIRRMLRILLNHDYLLRVINLESTRNLYSSLESVLNWDYHYWLQRGSAEVEKGDLNLAEQFLGQAKSLSPNDRLVQNEWAYLLLRKAIEHPMSKNAPKLVKEGTTILEALIANEHSLSSYPYHVMGSQGLAWSRRGLGPQERNRYLFSLMKMLEEGVQKYPRNRELAKLLNDIQREYLKTAIPDR